MILLKDAGAAIPVENDWAASLAAGDTVASSTWAVDRAESGGLAIDSDAETAAGVCTAIVSGGVAGRLYRLTNSIVTAAGYTDLRSVAIRIGPSPAEAA